MTSSARVQLGPELGENPIHLSTNHVGKQKKTPLLYSILFNQEADNLNLIIEKNTHHPQKPTTQTQSFPTFLKTLYTHSIPPPLSSSSSSSDSPRFNSIKNPNIPQQFLGLYKEGKKGLHF
ncbi:hypothetical protein L1987_02447 [Smallanthus sonchifolius]|uniref:Uncharacterized protein n=1 Tax=Smallanthus sonchifolius TaxID=185202 RepID=A0ACB9K7T0_9ASTR|nr:hypothetical protein L1987_02447 [Smallanthus sonchifolius]